MLEEESADKHEDIKHQILRAGKTARITLRQIAAVVKTPWSRTEVKAAQEGAKEEGPLGAGALMRSRLTADNQFVSGGFGQGGEGK